MKKVLFLETAASFYGIKRGGSYIQAQYYNDILRNNGYSSKIYIANSRTHKLIELIKIISEVKKTDYVIGFGTPLLCTYLQWLCFFVGRKGIFCLDTIIVPMQIINDNLKKNVYKKRFLMYAYFQFIIDNLLTKIVPQRLNLVHLSSCQYVKDKLIKTPLYPKGNAFLYPRVKIKKGKKGYKKNKIVLFYGILYRGRGIIDLLNACRLLWKKGYQFKLMIMGWPVESLTEKSLIDEVKDEEKENIIIKRKQKNIFEIIENSTVVVLPFRYPCSFQTPYTLLEPMGLGVPVITTDVGSHTEWVTHGETGLICKKENPEDLADKIEDVFTDKKLVNKITNGAIELLKKRYKEKDLLLETMKKLENET